jgi:hypothetical protein
MDTEAWILGVGAVLAIVIAGCVSGPSGPPVGTETVPDDAPQEAGEGDYALTLRVVEEPGGPPIEDAPVIAYWSDGGDEGDPTFEVSGEAQGGSGGGSAEGVVRLDAQPYTPSVDNTAPARTGSDGTATVNVPSDRNVGLVWSGPAHTEEWIPAASTGAGGSSGTLTVPVYHETLTNATEHEWGPAGASPGTATGSNYEWDPHEVDWGTSEEAKQGYIERLAELRVTVTWENQPTAAGDLGAAAGASPGQPDRLADQNENADVGEQSEQLLAPVEDVEEEGWPGSSTMYVGAASDSAYAAPMDLPYELETEARFDPFAQPGVSTGAQFDEAGLAGAMVLPAVLAGALVAPVRRR